MDDPEASNAFLQPSMLDLASTAPVPRRRSGSGTAKIAAELMSKREGFLILTKAQKRHVSEAFASVDKPVYGQAYDLVRVTGEPIDFNEVADVKDRLADLTLLEIKSTDKDRTDDFKGHFFSLSTAELLVAQKLGPQFRFLFVNVSNGHCLELSLTEVYERAKAIYPVWSIMF